MKTAAIISFALFGMTALSAPLTIAKRSPTNYSNVTVVSNSTTPSATTVIPTISAASTTASSTVAAYKGSRTLFPEVQMQFYPSNPSAMGEDVTKAVISSGPKYEKKVVAYNFNIGAEHNGKMCSFQFRVKSDNFGRIAHEFEGQDLIDVYHPKKACINNKSSYSELQNIEKTFLGRIKASFEDPSKWEYTPYVAEDESFPVPFHGTATSFPCNGQELVIELNAHNNNADIEWDTTLQNFGGLTVVTSDY